MVSRFFLSSIQLGFGLFSLALISLLSWQSQTQSSKATPLNSTSKNISTTVENRYRYFNATGIPNHETGTFPNRYNPNAIRPQQHRFRVTLHPEMAEAVISVMMRPFGIALNGVPFDPATAEAWNRDLRSGWNEEALGAHARLGLDQNNAHVQPTGAYHYHGLPTGLIQTQPSEQMLLIGYAADGFPIYAEQGYADPQNADSGLRKLRPSYRLKSGQRPETPPKGPGGTYDGTYTQDYEYVANLGDLDECNGQFGVTPDYPQGIYHYHVTETFPFVPRCWRGQPDPSFDRQRPRQQRPPQDSFRQRPHPPHHRHPHPPAQGDGSPHHRPR